MTDVLTIIVDAYLVCGLWSTTMPDPDGPGDANGHMDDHFDIEDCANRDDVEAELSEFLVANLNDIVAVIQIETTAFGRTYADAWSQIGHDICLTRDHHGAGFWDRGYGAVGQRLTEACNPYGGSDFYPEDDLNERFTCGGSIR